MNISIEYYQLVGDGPLNYFNDFWNINDLIRVILTWIYCALRMDIIGDGQWGGNFLLINDIEFGETHVESEILLDNFKNI